MSKFVNYGEKIKPVQGDFLQINPEMDLNNFMLWEPRFKEYAIQVYGKIAECLGTDADYVPVPPVAPAAANYPGIANARLNDIHDRMISNYEQELAKFPEKNSQ